MSRGWYWDYKLAIIFWVVIFISFGPIWLLFKVNLYKGSVIFSNNPPAYYLSQGLFIATFVVGVEYLVDFIVKSRRKSVLHLR